MADRGAAGAGDRRAGATPSRPPDGTVAQGATLQTPICSTTSCQVFRRSRVTPTPGIRRWNAAVNGDRRARSLQDGGRPIEAVYFSTSNGHTYGNDQVFGSAPLPYLRPVVEHDDGAFADVALARDVALLRPRAVPHACPALARRRTDRLGHPNAAARSS